MPRSTRSAAISRALSRAAVRPSARIDVVERAEHRAGRIDRPVRRAEALHPAALLVDQDRRVRLAERLAQFANKLSDLRRRFDIPLEQDEAPRPLARG